MSGSDGKPLGAISIDTAGAHQGGLCQSLAVRQNRVAILCNVFGPASFPSAQGNLLVVTPFDSPTASTTSFVAAALDENLRAVWASGFGSDAQDFGASVALAPNDDVVFTANVANPGEPCGSVVCGQVVEPKAIAPGAPSAVLKVRCAGDDFVQDTYVCNANGRFESLTAVRFAPGAAPVARRDAPRAARCGGGNPAPVVVEVPASSGAPAPTASTASPVASTATSLASSAPPTRPACPPRFGGGPAPRCEAGEDPGECA